MPQIEARPGLKRGDILEETDHFGPRRRKVFVRYNKNHRSGLDYSTERLNICALCGREEWVNELSRSTRWTNTALSQLLPNVQYCPDHARRWHGRRQHPLNNPETGSRRDNREDTREVSWIRSRPRDSNSPQ